MIGYRDASPEDAEAIASLFRRSFIDTFAHLYRPEDLSEFLATRGADRFADELTEQGFRIRLAEDEDQLAGYLMLGPPHIPVETPADTIELSQLYVLKQWHGSGIAAELMRWALATAHDAGSRHIQLSVYIDNHRARRFYERFGFEEVGRYDFMVGSHADEELVLRHVVLDREA